MTEAFDDKKLIELAKSYYYGEDQRSRPEIEAIFNKKDKLSNTERNALLNFIYVNKYSRPMSMTEMKRQIMKKIGVEPHSSYSNTISRGDLEAIYRYIMEGSNESED